MSARAEYIISARDATKDAIRSIQSNMRSLDRGISSTARSANLALGVLAGASLKGAFRSILSATVEAAGPTSAFATALDDVKTSARNLLAAKDGLPEATSAMQELAATLKDPEVQSAADIAASGIIKVGAAVARLSAEYIKLVSGGWKGWKILLTGDGGNEQVNIDTQMSRIQQQLELGKRGGLAPYMRDQLQRSLGEQSARYSLLSLGNGIQPITGTGISALTAGNAASAAIDSQVAAYEAAEASAKEYQETVKELNKTIAEIPGQMASESIQSLKETLRGEEEAAQRRDEFFRETQEQAREMAARGAKETQEMLSQATEYAKEAARNMQDAMADFLFDPFHDGLKGMLKGFIDTIRRIVAETAAAKIFGSKSSGGLGLGDLVTTGIGALFGGFKAEGGPLQQGKWYIAGERGPEPIWGGGAGAFASGYAGRGATPSVSNHFTIDARGAGPDVEQKIRVALAQAAPMIVDASRRAFKDDLSRRAIR